MKNLKKAPLLKTLTNFKHYRHEPFAEVLELIDQACSNSIQPTLIIF